MLSQDDPVFLRSELELRYIAEWYSGHFSRDAEPIKFLLVGGWAVWCYNSYYPSIDIDILSTNETRNSLFSYLHKTRAFDRRMSAQRNRMEFMIPFDDKEIIIDYEKPDAPGKINGKTCSLPWTFAWKNFKVHDIGKGYLPIPERGILLLHKLKAIIDRTWNVEHDDERKTWLIGKTAKDRADVLALLDPEKGGQEIDIGLMGRIIKGLPCLLEELKAIPEHSESYVRYKCERQEAKDWTGRLVSLISGD